MIVRYLDIISVSVRKPEADAPLIVYGDRVLSFPVSLQGVKAAARWNLQVVEPGGELNIFESSTALLMVSGWRRFDSPELYRPIVALSLNVLITSTL
jgi:hypothetical protein